MSGGYERGSGLFRSGKLWATEATLAPGGLCGMCPCAPVGARRCCILCMQVIVVFVVVNGVVGVTCWILLLCLLVLRCGCCQIFGVIVVFVAVNGVVVATY